jgi:hypothetical protein
MMIWFKLRRGAPGEISASSFVKCVAAIRVFAYGYSANTVDYFVGIGEDIILEVV